MNDTQYEIQYNLKFYKLCEQRGIDITHVNFTCTLTAYEIDTLTFLLAEYFNQQHLFMFDRLTFFNQYKYVIDVIKRDYEEKTDSDNEVKQIFKLFIDNDFIGQMPSFQTIIKSLRKYFKNVGGVELEFCEQCAPQQKYVCIKCRATYMSEALSLLDATLQDGWDIFFRPMLGIPILFFALFKTNMNEVDHDVFNVDAIVTNILLQFFHNLLSDRSTPTYWDYKKCHPLIEGCREYVLSVSNVEYLLYNLNNATYNTKVYTPLRQFMEKNYSSKQIGKLVHKIFIGFYLRVYLEAKKRNDQRLVNRRGAKQINVIDVANVELRNVCRVLFKDYTEENFERMVTKLIQIKTELFGELSQNYLAPKECVVRIFNKYDLKNDVSRLLQKTVSLV
ncbi:P48 [Erinnyis ello granulovirus]|uniref:p48 n=1 Tax=Erinnyis ello granulovirus TaxID=307444 RepID=A0A097DAP8_9BBAC|nr:P48 [Erinnyis ello granulovirus]AIS92075.1 P48 [Erinnyis ello granulovirus]ARX71415.1 p48 [Erinnyis ello granulovirus]ARX71545.1 p48 [Erinnyis ello granulovirus]ARX71675.1 p48 [Erinnyis ello granulovirus]ARX71805.1 p48 [Erinnyis ello granulovirus]